MTFRFPNLVGEVGVAWRVNLYRFLRTPRLLGECVLESYRSDRVCHLRNIGTPFGCFSCGHMFEDLHRGPRPCKFEGCTYRGV